jgi:hypothetical protein
MTRSSGAARVQDLTGDLAPEARHDGDEAEISVNEEYDSEVEGRERRVHQQKHDGARHLSAHLMKAADRLDGPALGASLTSALIAFALLNERSGARTNWHPRLHRFDQSHTVSGYAVIIPVIGLNWRLRPPGIVEIRKGLRNVERKKYTAENRLLTGDPATVSP